jgi:hypothetical protein
MSPDSGREDLLSQGTATVIAAGVALVASVLSLVVSGRSARKAEEREAHRRLIEPYLQDLGEAVHEVIASSSVLSQKYRAGQDPRQWLDQGNAAADRIRTVRPRLRYLLDGLDDPLRTLTRLPDWTATLRAAPSAERFTTRASRLGRRVDRAIARSFRRGRPPATWERWRLRRANAALRKAWEKRFKGVPRSNGEKR